MTTYVLDVAPETGLEFTCQLYVNVGFPVHDPELHVNVFPGNAVPEIDGGEVSAGGAA